MRSELAKRLIKRVVAEQTKRARTPRRGIATYYPLTPAPSSVNAQGSPAQVATTSAFPPLNSPIGGFTPTVVGGEIIDTWPVENQPIDVRLGAPQPTIQPQNESILQLLNTVFSE